MILYSIYLAKFGFAKKIKSLKLKFHTHGHSTRVVGISQKNVLQKICSQANSISFACTRNSISCEQMGLIIL